MATKLDLGATPNRRTVEALLRNLCNRSFGDDPLYQRYREADQRREKIKNEVLKASKEYQAAKREMERAYEVHDIGSEFFKYQARYIYMKYQASGLTPAVLTLLQELVEQIPDLEEENPEVLREKVKAAEKKKIKFFREKRRKENA